MASQNLTSGQAATMQSGEMSSHFSNQAAIYEKLTGGTTRRIAEACLPYLPTLTSKTRILDNACGPGVVTRLILDTAASQGVQPPPQITGVDNAQGMIEQFCANAKVEGWTTTKAFLLSADKLEGIEDAHFDAAVMNFGIFAIPDAVVAAKEMYRTLQKGGVAVVTTWKKSVPVDLIEETVGQIRPQDKAKVFPISKDWMTAEKVKDTMVQGGFADVRVTEKGTMWMNDSADELVDVLTGPFWQRIWADWSEEDKSKLKPGMMKALKDMGGPKSMEMLAWVCVGVKNA